MFACVVAGRPVRTDFQQIDATKFSLEVPDAASVKHVCVFLTQQLPSGAAVGLHASWGPDFAAWIPLGVLANDKPSAVFRVSKPADSNLAYGPSTPVSMRIGVSMEPVDSIALQHAQQAGAKAARQSAAVADKAVCMLRHFYNYAASFVNNGFIPQAVLEKWYQSFLAKLQANPQLLDREQQ
jgi:hypothetical protein